MKRSWLVCTFVLGAAALLTGAAVPGPMFQFTEIDYPGAVLTQGQGINPGGEIVGLYRDNAGKTHGFLLTGGNFTSIDYPGSIYTDARGIGPGGDIVGAYMNAPGGPPNMHGYLLSQGNFSEVQYPGYLGTIAQRISPNGDIYGCNHDTDFMARMHGFRRTLDGYTQLDVPASMNNGATPDGAIVAGLYTDMMTGLTHGYLMKNGSFEPFDVPGSNLTQAWDINPAGDVVGHYRDTTGRTHGFLLSRGQFTALDFPGAINTQARGINPGGDILGWYVDSTGHTHGFMRSLGAE